MPSPYEQCLASLKEVIAFYGERGCPCAFPRFGQLTQFYFRNYTDSPVGCHATEIAIALVTGDNGFYRHVRDAGDVRQLECRICGSEIDSRWEQFNIQMDVTSLVYRIVRAQPVGLSANPVIPLPQGFFGFQNAQIRAAAAAFSTEATFEEMVNYLQALRES